MEESTATAIEVETDVEVDTSISHEELWSPYSTCSTRVAEDDCASASSALLARSWKHPYIIVAQETTPLLHKADRMSAQLSSPIEIAGIEGQDGAERPWLKALEAQKKKPWWETPSVFWLLPPFLLYCLAMGAVSVPKLNVILNLICRQYHVAPTAHNTSPIISLHSTIGEDNPECQTADVHALLGRFMLYANLISGTLCAFSSPRLGALSDRYGRRLILAVTALGMLLGDVITITAASFPDSLSVYWILVEFGFGGLAGAFIATMAVIQSYAADCTPPARRSVVFGYLHGCMFLGIAAGPILGGLIIKATGNIMTIFYVAFVCHLGFIVFITSFVPESLSRQRQIAARERHRAELLKHPRGPWTTFTNIANIFKPLSILFPPRNQTSNVIRTNLVLLATVDTVVFGVTLGSASLVVMYSEFMFKWGNFESSLFVSIANTCRVGMLVIALPLVFRIFSHRLNQLGHGPASRGGGNSDKFDIAIIRVAVFFDVLGYIGYAIVPTGTLFIIAGVVASVGGIASPTLQSALTTHVTADKTGELLGAISLLHALSRIAAPATLHLVYSLTVGKASSAVFWCLAAVFAGAWAVAWGIRARERDTGRGEYGRI